MNNQSNNDSDNKRIALNSMYMSIRMAFVLIITLYTTRVVLDILGIIDYGIYNVVCGFVSMFSVLNTAMSNGIQRYYNYEWKKNGIEAAKDVFNTSIIIQAIVVLLIIVIGESTGLWYISNQMVLPADRMLAAHCVYQCSLFSFVFITMQSPFLAAIMSHEEMGFFSFVSILENVLKLGIVYILPKFSCDMLILYGVLVLLIHLTDLMLYVSFARIHFGEIRFQRGFKKSLFLSMISFSGWNIFGSFGHMMKEQGINLLLNAFFGPIVNAARGIAAQVSAGLQSFVSNIAVPVRPQVVNSYAIGDISRVNLLTNSVAKYSCVLLYMMSLPLVTEIDYILTIWLGANIPKHTTSFVLIIILTSFLNNMNAPISNVIHATGVMKRYQIASSLIVLSSIPIGYFVLYLGGTPESALWVVFFTMIVAQAVSLHILGTIIDFPIMQHLRTVIIPLIKVVCLTIWVPFLVAAMFDNSILRLIIVTCISEISIVASLFFFGMTTLEKIFISKQIKKIVYKLHI